MAVGIILIAVLSIVAVAMAWFSLAPVINELGAPEDINNHWTEASEQAIFARDQTFKSLLVLPLVLIGAIVIWAILATTRRDYVSYE
jgi:hypothetical protein